MLILVQTSLYNIFSLVDFFKSFWSAALSIHLSKWGFTCLGKLWVSYSWSRGGGFFLNKLVVTVYRQFPSVCFGFVANTWANLPKDFARLFTINGEWIMNFGKESGRNGKLLAGICLLSFVCQIPGLSLRSQFSLHMDSHWEKDRKTEV